MTFKSPTQPFCRCCGKAIRKRTEMVLFGREKPARPILGPAVADDGRRRSEKPGTREEAQRLINTRIVSVSYAAPYWMEKAGRKFIDKVTTWDGETYEAEYFCTNRCAMSFARLMAKTGQCTHAYNEAVSRAEARNRIMGEVI